MKKLLALMRPSVVVAVLAMLPRVALASSHMDAPLITLDDPANTTDVYAFVAKGPDVAAGRATFSYQFRFTTRFKNRNTILDAFTGVIQHVNDAHQNMV